MPKVTNANRDRLIRELLYIREMDHCDDSTTEIELKRSENYRLLLTSFNNDELWIEAKNFGCLEYLETSD